MDIANKLHEKGHKVDMYALHSDLNVELLKDLQVPIHLDYKSIKKCDLLITNSDNPENEYFSNLKHVRKKMLLKLSHNKRFQSVEDKSLTLKWDKIITSSQWLTDVCQKPLTEEGWTHKPCQAERLGWWHYDHKNFAKKPTEKIFRTITDLKTPIVISTLAHHYPLKGTPDAMKVLDAIKTKYGSKVHIVTIGEQQEWAKQKPEWAQFIFNASRTDLATVMAQTDIWLSCSHSEGLGRMMLEAMSASCGVVMTDTGAEYAQADHNCLIGEIGNIRQLYALTEKLIEDHELRKTLATNGYTTAEKWSNSIDYTERLNRLIEDTFDAD